MLMFDSLNRRFLEPYGCDWTHTPQFNRLARRTVTFDTSYVCSMPCMPARRDFHTGRPNFLHRSWGPLEPFDDSVPQMLQEAGVETALISDHYHYWEDGGATYHHRYGTWQHHRGQEGDLWMGQAEDEPPDSRYAAKNASPVRGIRQDRVNRKFMPTVAEHSQTRTFDAGINFLDRNAHADHWFLQLECFDPHEPFFVHDEFRAAYEDHYRNWEGPTQWDWPDYGPVTESPEWVEHMRHQYAALLAMCDHSLGRVLDKFDEYGLWDDTMLVVCTDHGIFLGEGDQWLKNWMPLRDPIARTPFFVWDPRCGKTGERRGALVQPSVDLGPTLLNLFGVAPTPDMLGHDLTDTIAADTPVREAGIFGYHGRAVNVTDGRYVYTRGLPEPSPGAGSNNAPLFDYTLMPTHMNTRFKPEELSSDRVALAEPFSFTKGCPTLKIGLPADRQHNPVPELERASMRSMLFDTQADPSQNTAIEDAAVERRMVEYLLREMRRADAPAEQYERLGLSAS
ncbi:MAG: sulfatase [Planctomycetota bacterium]